MDLGLPSYTRIFINTLANMGYYVADGVNLILFTSAGMISGRPVDLYLHSDEYDQDLAQQGGVPADGSSVQVNNICVTALKQQIATNIVHQAIEVANKVVDDGGLLQNGVDMTGIITLTDAIVYQGGNAFPMDVISVMANQIVGVSIGNVRIVEQKDEVGI